MIGTISMLGYRQHSDTWVSSIWELQAEYRSGSPNIVWPFNTRKLFRIWYSTDPNVFLPFVNQLRFIQMRNDNPEAIITFIYSSRCLNEEAKKNLDEFCGRHSINPIDFDLLKSMMKNDTDALFWEYANQEINQFKEGLGITAAASDFTRLNTEIIELFGHYSDFDINIKFGRLPPLLSVRFPIIVNAEFEEDFFGNLDTSVSNDFIGVTHDRFNPNHLSLNAKERIRRLQELVIARYESPSRVFYYSEHNPLMFCLLRNSMLTPHLKDIYSFRKFVQELSLDEYYNLLKMEPALSDSALHDTFSEERTDSDKAFVDLIKETDLSKQHHRFEFDKIDRPTLSIRQRAELFFSHIKSIVIQDSVIGLAGPNVYPGLFRIDSDDQESGAPGKQDHELCNFAARNLGLYFASFSFNGLKPYITLNRLISRFFIDNDGEPGSDFSWTEEGQREVAFATQKIIAAGKVIVSAFEAWHSKRENVLLPRMMPATTSAEKSSKHAGGRKRD